MALVASPTSTASMPRSRSSTKLADDVTSLTSFNPFSEEDENDQSSYALVTSLFSRMKNSLAAPLSNGPVPSNSPNTPAEIRRPSHTMQTQSSFPSRGSNEKPNSLKAATHANPAPPLVSLTPAQSDLPTYHPEYDRSPSRSGMLSSSVYEVPEGGFFSTSIPGFPIQDDARSIKTTGSLHRSNSVSKVIRRIRGEGKYSATNHP